jgi:hypothetical protein
LGFNFRAPVAVCFRALAILFSQPARRFFRSGTRFLLGFNPRLLFLQTRFRFAATL